MIKQINAMIAQLDEWLKSLESSKHTGNHADCPDCQRFNAILGMWAATTELRDLIVAQGDADQH